MLRRGQRVKKSLELREPTTSLGPELREEVLSLGTLRGQGGEEAKDGGRLP